MPTTNPLGEQHHRQIESQPWKLDAWAAELGIPKQQVRQLAAEVGPVFERIHDAWIAKTSQRLEADAVRKEQRDAEPPSLDDAQAELVAWLRAANGNHRRRSPEGPLETRDEIVRRFLHCVEAAGFKLTMLATGTPGEPGFRGSWECHGATVGPATLPESSDQDEATLLACAGLLRDDLCRRYLARQDVFVAAA